MNWRAPLPLVIITLLLQCLVALPPPLAEGGAAPDGPLLLSGTPVADGPNVTVGSVSYPGDLDPMNYSDVLVLINNNSQMSRDVGEYFAAARGVPDRQVAYLDVPAREVINKDQFEDLKAQVKQYMIDEQLVNRVNIIVTTKGFPLKIYNQSLLYEACVDEELALIFTNLEGSIGNYFYVSNPYYGERDYFDHDAFGMYLVNRLTGYTWEDVKGLIDRANDTIGNRGKFVLDVDPTKGYSTGGYGVGNLWLRNARDALVPRGEDVLFDETRWYVNYQQDVMGYGSWGSNDANDTDHAKPHNTWVNGSIAETFVSTGGRTFTPPPRYGQSMVADLIEEGVTGVKGYVYEPFLSAIAHPDILFERYTAGFSLAESYRMASVMLGWMGVVVGDPKCAAYRDVPDLVVSNGMLSVSNATPAQDDPLQLYVTVRNKGGRAENVSVLVTIDGNTTVLGNATFEAFSETHLTINMTAPHGPSEHLARLYLNWGEGQVFETLHSNNDAEIRFTVLERPVISLGASSLEFMTQERVLFEVSLLGAPRQVEWYYFDFGDGTPWVKTQSPSFYHDWADDGNYTVTSYVLDEGMVVSQASKVVVGVLNRAPTAIIQVSPGSFRTGEAVTLNASLSSDADGEVVAVSWDFGDGNVSSDGTAEHAYDWPLEYVVTLTVTDDDGATDTTTRRVTAGNRPPLAAFDAPAREVNKGASVTFNASDSQDPDGRITQYEWDFGDGTTGEVVTSPWVVHEFTSTGVFDVTLTVYDDFGSPASTSLEMTVVNLPPEGLSVSVEPSVVETSEYFTIQASGAVDPDGTIAGYRFYFDSPMHGRLFIWEGIQLDTSVSHSFPRSGTYTLGVIAYDDDMAEVEANATVTVLNRPPTVTLAPSMDEYIGVVLEAPATVVLEALVTDPDGVVASVRWLEGGDGPQVAEGAQAIAEFSYERKVTIFVWVEDDEGARANASFHLAVNQRPVARFNVNGVEDSTLHSNWYPGTELRFLASTSSDPGGIESFEWDLGDGRTASGETVVRSYAQPGLYTVTLKVTDANGASDTNQTVVEVLEPPREPAEVPWAALGVAGLVIAIVAVVTVYAVWRRSTQ